MRFGKHTGIKLLSATLLLGWVGSAHAEDQPGVQPPPPGDRPERPERPGGRGEGFRPDAKQMVERFRGRLEGLNLSEDQKKKVDEILGKTEKDLAAAITEGPEGREKIRETMREMTMAVGETLDETQREKMRESIRPGGGPGGPGEGRPDGPPRGEGRRRGPGGPEGAGRPDGPPPGGPGGREPGAMLGRLKDNLGKLELNDEQKSKVEALIAETQKKLSELQTDSEKQQAETRGKFRDTVQASHDKLDAILTDTQKQKLRELMPPRPQPEGERGPRGPRPDGPRPEGTPPAPPKA